MELRMLWNFWAYIKFGRSVMVNSSVEIMASDWKLSLFIVDVQVLLCSSFYTNYNNLVSESERNK